MSVIVVFEQRSGELNRVSYEALTAGEKVSRAYGVPLSIALLGKKLEGLAQQAASYAVERVFVLENDLLDVYTAEAYTAGLEQLVRGVRPKAVVFPHTYQVRDYAPKLAAHFSTPLISDVIEIKESNNSPVFVRQFFQGKLHADVYPSSEIAFASVQMGAFRTAEPAGRNAPIEKFALQIDPAQIRSKPEMPFRETQRSVDLSAAERIVAVGRGIKERENLRLVEELAAALHAELAASRPICDNGWLPMERQVGSSGQSVAPKLYIAVGISGAIQHLVGMKGSKTVVAINRDESAPIFEAADYGIVGDLFEVVPALIEEIRKTNN
jgi:electron transfer flavoprotein alpha subunit